MKEKRNPQRFEIWEREGKQREVVSVGKPHPYMGRPSVEWRAVGPNHGYNHGFIELKGWHRRGWKLAKEAPLAA